MQQSLFSHPFESVEIPVHRHTLYMQVLANSKPKNGVHLGEGRKPIWQYYQILYLKWYSSILGGIGHVMLDWIFSPQVILIIYNPGMFCADVCSVSGKAFAHSFTIILLQAIFFRKLRAFRDVRGSWKAAVQKGWDSASFSYLNSSVWF